MTLPVFFLTNPQPSFSTTPTPSPLFPLSPRFLRYNELLLLSLFVVGLQENTALDDGRLYVGAGLCTDLFYYLSYADRATPLSGYPGPRKWLKGSNLPLLSKLCLFMWNYLAVQQVETRLQARKPLCRCPPQVKEEDTDTDKASSPIAIATSKGGGH